MCRELIEIQKKLLEMTEKAYSIGMCDKLGEPSIYVGIGNDMKWFAEIYSYMLELSDSGRHHYFHADSFEELIKKIWNAIERAEKILHQYELEKVIKENLKLLGEKDGMAKMV